MQAIHLIQKDDPEAPKPTPIAKGSNTYRSGNWVVAEDTAQALVGKMIYFHRKQATASFFGGRIIKSEKKTELEGRVIFTFEADQDCKGVKAGTDGWSQEIKLQK